MENWITLTELGERKCTAIKIKLYSTSGIGDSGNYNFTREYGVQGSEWGIWGSNFRFDLTAYNVCDFNIKGGLDTYYNDWNTETYQGEYNGKEYYITYDGEYVQWEWTEPLYYYGFGDTIGDFDPAPVAADYIYVMLEGVEEPEESITIADNLQRIIQAKSDIKASIENKGVVVGDITIDGYSKKIDEIIVGEGSAKTVLPNGICLSGSTWETFDATPYEWKYVRDMSYMFYNCFSLTSLDVSNWDTSNVTDMRYMFDTCESLTSLDVSNWDTSNVTDMRYMFSTCSNLTSLDVSNWNTSNVTDMSEMFIYDSNLTSLDVSNWDTSNVTDMSEMFYYCNYLTSLDVSNWNTSKVTNMRYMFSACNKLTSLDVSNWDTSNVTVMSHMFNGCGSLTSLDLSNWDTSNVTNMSYMFNGCKSLTSLDLSNWDTSNVTDMSYMFQYCSNLTELKMGGDVSKVTSMSNMFRYITTTGTFYYNPQYDYSNIIAQLPSTWTAVPM